MTPSEAKAVIDEIREVRHRVSERFDHDPQRLIAYYMELQQHYRERLVESQAAPEKKGPSAA